MFAFIQMLACYAVAGMSLLFLALAAGCQCLYRLVYAWSSSSAPRPPTAKYDGRPQ